MVLWRVDKHSHIMQNIYLSGTYGINHPCILSAQLRTWSASWCPSCLMMVSRKRRPARWWSTSVGPSITWSPAVHRQRGTSCTWTVSRNCRASRPPTATGRTDLTNILFMARKTCRIFLRSTYFWSTKAVTFDWVSCLRRTRSRAVIYLIVCGHAIWHPFVY